VIVVVCLNPALDVTHQLDAVGWGGVNRPRAVHARPGGKGLNAARTLHSLGADVLMLGLAGGITGAGVQASLCELGVPAAFTPVAGETRRTFTVVADRLSGSLPPGLPAGTYAALIRAARVPVVLDTHGEALWQGTAAGPAIVKQNRAELEALAGRSLTTPGEVAVAAGALGGAGAVVVTLGPAGLLAATGDGCWRARVPAAVAGNATGAGDAVAAALAHGIALRRPWDEQLRHAAALGAATAAAPVAGEFRRPDYLDALRAVAVEEGR